MDAYSTSFSIRHDGEYRKATVLILPEGNSHTVKDMVLASDPVVVTYEDAELTDTIHPSQLRLTLIATEDGQYRDIIESPSKVWCVLTIQDGAVAHPVWQGILATRTWSEPFSREKNYEVEFTFSDFGYLKRVDYSPELLFTSGDDTTGSVKVLDFLEAVCSLMSVRDYNFDVTYHGLDKAAVNGTAFKDLRIRTRNFVDEDGKGLPLYDCIEKVLAPAGIHIMQFGATFHLYRPDMDTYLGIAASMRSSLKAMGTDAELESAELYKSVELTYDQEPSSVLGGVSLDESDAGYEGPWQYVDNGGNRQFLLCGPTRYSAGAKGYVANYIDGTRVTPCLWLVNGWATQFKVPDGFTAPSDMPEEIVSDLATMSVEFQVAVTDSTRESQYPPSSSAITVTVPVLISFSFIGNIHDVSMRARVVLAPSDGSQTLYLTSVGWSGTDDGSFRIHYEKHGESDWNKDWPTQWQNLVGTIPAPSKQGKIRVTIYPSTTATDHEYTGEVTPARDPNYTQYAIEGITVETDESFSSRQIVAANKVSATFDENSDDFSKDFEMGTPVLLSAGTYTGYTSSGYKEIVKDGDTYLDRYLGFLRSNFSLEDGDRRRWRVRGAYAYDHLSGLPVFDVTSIPLATLLSDSFAFFLKSEEWHVRSGRSTLEIEEAYVGDPTDYILVTEDGDPVVDESGTYNFTVRRKVVGI